MNVILVLRGRHRGREYARVLPRVTVEDAVLANEFDSALLLLAHRWHIENERSIPLQSVAAEVGAV